MIRAYLLDDEPLALDRLRRMLLTTGRVEVIGFHTDPTTALDEICVLQPELLFLDIHMPGLTGFELLTQLNEPPLVIFTTAYDQYALQAFQANSIDYLLKPIEPDHLDRALTKALRMRGGDGQDTQPALQTLLAQLGSVLASKKTSWLERVASRTGDKWELVDLARVTHFFSSDKLTYAATVDRRYVVDQTITELESKLDPARFVRIHRATILNLDYLRELHTWFGGKMVARLKDAGKTELSVSRDRVRPLKEKLGV
jgi:two-component system, LytTR family, response regulator